MRVLLLLLAASALSACSNLNERFEKGSQALSTGEGAAYFVRLGPILQDALNICIPSQRKPPSPMIMLLADVTPDGKAQDVVVEPESEGTRCVADEFTRARLPSPPLRPGEEAFPIGIRVDMERPR